MVGMTIDGQEDLDGLLRAARVVAEARQEMVAAVAPGITTGELDAVGRDVFRRHGARSAPRITYRFPGSTCISVNDEAAHGVPSLSRHLRAGDLVNLDVSAELDGYFSDTGISVAVGPVAPMATRLLEATKQAQADAMAAAQPGARLRDIGRAVERRARRHGFCTIRNLNGHGIGRGLHEGPSVPSVDNGAAHRPPRGAGPGGRAVPLRLGHPRGRGRRRVDPAHGRRQRGGPVRAHHGRAAAAGRSSSPPDAPRRGDDRAPYAPLMTSVDGSDTAQVEWPELTLDDWAATLDALQLWTQVVGKVRLALEPMVNHWWQVPLYVSARGLTTSLMHRGSLGLEMEFDFLTQRLEIRTADGRYGHVPLAATVGRRLLRRHDGGAGRGRGGGHHQSVAPGAPRRGALSRRHRWPGPTTPTRSSVSGWPWSRCTGSCGSSGPDSRARSARCTSSGARPTLAVTRFSGREAPRHPGGAPHCAAWVQEMAYSHEVSSCGFWPGGTSEGSFYAYAYPTPEGFAEWAVAPAAASYDTTLGEFVLPYADVRRADDPEGLLLEFFQSTYEAAAELAHWDRHALEVGPDGPARGLIGRH